VLNRLPADPPSGAELYVELLTATAELVTAFVPLYRPQIPTHPRYVEMADCDELSNTAFHEWFEPTFVALL
jgi:hypothetical protein